MDATLHSTHAQSLVVAAQFNVATGNWKLDAKMATAEATTLSLKTSPFHTTE